MKHRLTASAIETARNCLYRFRGDVEWQDVSPTGAMTFGNAFHDAANRTGRSKGGVDPLESNPHALELGEDDQAKLTRYYETWLAYWIKRLDESVEGTTFAYEVPVAWNVYTGKGRLLTESKGHRDYSSATEQEIPGTIDLIEEPPMGSGRPVRIDDWKTGRSWLPTGENNPQLVTLAGGFGVTRETQVAIVKCGEDRVDEYPGPIDAFSLADMQAELRGMLEAMPSAEPTPGHQCVGCPAAHKCPASANAAQEVALVAHAATMTARHRVSLTIVDAAQAQESLPLLDAVKAFVKQWEAAIKEWADKNGGVVLPDGRVWAARPMTSESVDLEGLSGPEAIEWLDAHALGDAVKQTVTWDAIKKLAGPKQEKEARKALKALGAIKTSSYSKYEARKP